MPRKAADDAISLLARVITPRRTADFARSYLRLRRTFPRGPLLLKSEAHRGLVRRRFAPVRFGWPLRGCSQRFSRYQHALKASPLALPSYASQAPYA